MNTKLLRQKILDLAIRGKLTEQKKSDGTTKDLLKQIQDERTGEALQTRDSSTCHCEAQKRRGNLKQSKSATPKEIIPLDKSEAPFEIPENWEWVRLGDLMCKIGSGSTPTGGKKIYGHTGIMFIRSQNVYNDGLILDDVAFIDPAIHEKMQGSKVVASDLLLNITGASIGRCSIVPKDFETANINQHVLILRLISKAMLGYVHTAITSKFVFGQIMASQVGGTKEGLSAERAKSLLIPLPPLAEQQRIVEAIEKAFAEITEIENNQELLKKHIKQGRQKILDLAIRGKLTQQLKTDGTTKDLLKQIQDERTGEALQTRDASTCHCEAQKRRGNLKQSKSAFSKEIIPLDKTTAPFEIPSTWEWVKLGDICDISSAKRVLQEDWKDSGIPFYRAREIAQLANGEKVKDDLFITKELYQSLKAKYGVPQSEDILMSAVGTIGKTYIVKETDQFYYKDASVICLKKKSSQILAKFLKVLLASDFLQKQMYANSSGTTVDTITISVAQEYVLPLPPLAEQQRIVATIEQAFAEFDAMERK